MKKVVNSEEVLWPVQHSLRKWELLSGEMKAEDMWCLQLLENVFLKIQRLRTYYMPVTAV